MQEMSLISERIHFRLWSPTNTKSPTFMYISQSRGSGNRVSDFRVSGGPPVPCVLVQPVHSSMKGCQCLTKCLIVLSFIKLVLKYLQLVLTLRTTQATDEIFCL